MTHRDIVLRTLSRFGFKVNRENSVLTPKQDITFLGLTLNSLTYRARGSARLAFSYRGG